MILQEFLEHNIEEGFDTFFLIDNGSTDSSVKVIETIQRKQPECFFKVLSMPTPNAQVIHQNTVLQQIQTFPCKYLAVLDCDEFLFTPNPNLSTKEMIQKIFEDHPNVSAVEAPWWCFGSSGYKKQPASIRKSFTWCKPLPSQWEELWNKLGHWKKTIQKVQDILSLDVHEGRTKGKTLNKQYTADLLRINHYKIMSQEYFFQYKATRGDVHKFKWNNLRNSKYFQEFDFQDIQDFTLKRRIELREQNHV